MQTRVDRKQRRSPLRILLVFLVLVLLASAIYLLSAGDGTAMKRLYSSEVEAALAQVSYTSDVFTERDIATLPEPLQRFFRQSGLLGQKKMSTARIVFKDVDFINGDRKLKLTSEQYNFVQNPTRIAYLNSRIMGVIPFEGRDKYQSGQGFMTGKLMKVIPLFDVTGPEMKQSGLVTFLSEIMVVPSVALQDYVQWVAVDQNHVKATITDQGISVSGIFTINDEGEFIQFETDDRYMDKGNGVMAKERWVAEVSDYAEINGLRLPTRMKGIWKLAEGDLVYFDGTVAEIAYDDRATGF